MADEHTKRVGAASYESEPVAIHKGNPSISSESFTWEDICARTKVSIRHEGKTQSRVRLDDSTCQSISGKSTKVQRKRDAVPIGGYPWVTRIFVAAGA